jgi:hypothetical protein
MNPPTLVRFKSRRLFRYVREAKLVGGLQAHESSPLSPKASPGFGDPSV